MIAHKKVKARKRKCFFSEKDNPRTNRNSKTIPKEIQKLTAH